MQNKVLFLKKNIKNAELLDIKDFYQYHCKRKMNQKSKIANQKLIRLTPVI